VVILFTLQLPLETPIDNPCLTPDAGVPETLVLGGGESPSVSTDDLVVTAMHMIASICVSGSRVRVERQQG
jgi:hypothetical protein